MQSFFFCFVSSLSPALSHWILLYCLFHHSGEWRNLNLNLVKKERKEKKSIFFFLVHTLEIQTFFFCYLIDFFCFKAEQQPKKREKNRLFDFFFKLNWNEAKKSEWRNSVNANSIHIYEKKKFQTKSKMCFSHSRNKSKNHFSIMKIDV